MTHLDLIANVLGADVLDPKNLPIPTGSAALDDALGIGGYPRSRITEISGPRHSGKGTLALHAIRNVQQAGGVAALIDVEHDFRGNLARTMGVDLSKLLVSQPDNGEQAFDIVSTLTKSSTVDLIVVDSTGALLPRAEIDGDTFDLGLQARLASQATRKLAAVASKTSTALIFLTHLAKGSGPLPGITALKFYSSVRLDVCRVGTVDLENSPTRVVIGHRTRVRVVKNKLAAPFNEASFDIHFNGAIV